MFITIRTPLVSDQENYRFTVKYNIINNTSGDVRFPIHFIKTVLFSYREESPNAIVVDETR